MPDTTVAITNLSDLQLIAITDPMMLSGQAAANGRRPSKRILTVKGTAAGTATVFLKVARPAESYQTLSVDSTGRWTADVDVSSAAPLTLTASAGMVSQTVQVHIIELVIDTPIEDARFQIANEPPAMPTIQCRAHLDYGSDLLQKAFAKAITAEVSFTWKIDVGTFHVVRNPPPDDSHGHYEPFPPFETTSKSLNGLLPWIPEFPAIYGGWGKIVVSTDLHTPAGGTMHVVSDARWIDIYALNPSQADVIAYLTLIADNTRDVEPATDVGPGTTGITEFTVMKKIIQHESNWTQFDNAVKRRCYDPVDLRCPDPGPKPGRPDFSCDPIGMGITKQDPGTFPLHAWNWHANVDAGVTEYRQKRSTFSHRITRQHWQNYVDQTAADAAGVVNANRARHTPPLPALAPPRHHVPEPSPQQYLLDGLQWYNGGMGLRYDAAWVPRDGDGLDFQLNGTQWTYPNPHSDRGVPAPTNAPGTESWIYDPQYRTHPRYAQLVMAEAVP